MHDEHGGPAVVSFTDVRLGYLINFNTVRLRDRFRRVVL